MSDMPTSETDAVEYRLMRDALNHNQGREALVFEFGGFARNLERQRDEARALARELRDALDGVIFSASPNRRENPTMFAAWEEARPILAKAKEVLP
jgi:hypothetical protein